MIVIETCPKCGHDIVSSCVDTSPPITMKYCTVCDWYWKGEPEKIVKVPFDGNNSSCSTNFDIKIDNEYLNTINNNMSTYSKINIK